MRSLQRLRSGIRSWPPRALAAAAAAPGRRLRRSGRRGRRLRWPSPRPRPFPVPSVRRRSSELSSPPPGRMHVMPFGARAPPQPRTLRSFTPEGVLPPPPCKVTLTASMRSGGHRSAPCPPLKGNAFRESLPSRQLVCRPRHGTDLHANPIVCETQITLVPPALQSSLQHVSPKPATRCSL